MPLLNRAAYIVYSATTICNSLVGRHSDSKAPCIPSSGTKLVSVEHVVHRHPPRPHQL